MRPQDRSTGNRSSRLWLWVVLACAIQLAAWLWWLAFAGRHPVQEVPLVKVGRMIAPAGERAETEPA